MPWRRRFKTGLTSSVRMMKIKPRELLKMGFKEGPCMERAGAHGMLVA